VEEQVLAYIK